MWTGKYGKDNSTGFFGKFFHLQDAEAYYATFSPGKDGKYCKIESEHSFKFQEAIDNPSTDDWLSNDEVKGEEKEEEIFDFCFENDQFQAFVGEKLFGWPKYVQGFFSEDCKE